MMIAIAVYWALTVSQITHAYCPFASQETLETVQLFFAWRALRLRAGIGETWFEPDSAVLSRPSLCLWRAAGHHMGTGNFLMPPLEFALGLAFSVLFLPGTPSCRKNWGWPVLSLPLVSVTSMTVTHKKAQYFHGRKSFWKLPGFRGASLLQFLTG